MKVTKCEKKFCRSGNRIGVAATLVNSCGRLDNPKRFVQVVVGFCLEVVWNHIYQPSASPVTSPQPKAYVRLRAPPATVTPASTTSNTSTTTAAQAPAEAVHPDHQQHHQQHDLKQEAPQQLAAAAPTRRIRIRTTTAATTAATTAIVIATTTVYLNGKYAWFTAFSPQYLGEHLLRSRSIVEFDSPQVVAIFIGCACLIFCLVWTAAWEAESDCQKVAKIGDLSIERFQCSSHKYLTFQKGFGPVWDKVTRASRGLHYGLPDLCGMVACPGAGLGRQEQHAHDLIRMMGIRSPER